MRKHFLVSIRVLMVTLALIISSLALSLTVNAVAVSGDHSYIERSEDGIKINGGTYRVVENLKKEDLYFGVKYKNDSIMVSTTLPERMTEYALGGETYGKVPFNMNEEYSGSAHVLEVPVDTGVEIIPWQVVKNGVWQLATVITIAKDFELHHPEYKVIAAINGSFFDINNTNNYGHTSSGSIAAFGENYKLTKNDAQICFTNDGTANSIVDTNTQDRTARPMLTIFDKDGNSIYHGEVAKTNEAPGENELSVYYGLYDSNHKCQDIEVSDAFIVDGSDAYTVAYSGSTFYGKGEITKQGSATLSTNQFALVSNNSEVTSKLAVGTVIRVQYESNNISSNGDNSIYYVDKIVNNGEELDQVANAGVLSSYSQYRYPRTLVGKKADGTVVLTVTDGRQAQKGYYGMNGTECAAQMMYYDCVDAYVFDGGGSTSMAIMQDGELQYVNSGSDGSPRSDGNGILVCVKVPTMEIDSKSTQDSISLNINVTKTVEKYSDLYVAIEDDYKKVESGKKIDFTGLDVYKDYNYQVYAKIGETYLSLPYTGIINTAKHKVEFNNLNVKLDGDKYKVTYDISDIDEAVSSIAIKLNGKTIRAQKDTITIDKEFGSPVWEDATIIITYDVQDLGKEKKNPVQEEITVCSSIIESNAAFESIVSEVGSYINRLFK